MGVYGVVSTASPLSQKMVKMNATRMAHESAGDAKHKKLDASKGGAKKN